MAALLSISADGHFNIPEGTITIVSRKYSWQTGEDSWEAWGVDKKKVKIVTIIPDSVTTIGDDAFSGCSLLASITITDSVTAIGNGAFAECSLLASITIPDSVTTIGYCAFKDCSSLASISIPDSITTIGNGAFINCSSLTSITIPDSVTTIGNQAFKGCTSLASITIPESVTIIEMSAFQGCNSLVSITIPDSVSAIGDGAFDGCSSLASVTIGDSVTTIGVAAFYGCSSLVRVTIGDSVTTIGGGAFNGCTSLATLIAPLSSKLTVAKSSFYGGAFGVCPNLKLISTPDQIVAALKVPFAACTTLADLPPAVTKNAFKIQLDTYFWSMIIHRNTDRLSAKQCEWVKNLLTVGSRARLHWRPFNKGPRSVACIPTPGHPPLPCIMNDIWLLVLKFVRLSELGVYSERIALDAGGDLTDCETDWETDSSSDYY